MKIGHHYRTNLWCGIYKNPEMVVDEIDWYPNKEAKNTMLFVVDKIEHNVELTIFKVLTDCGKMGWIFVDKDKQNKLNRNGRWRSANHGDKSKMSYIDEVTEEKVTYNRVKS